MTPSDIEDRPIHLSIAGLTDRGRVRTENQDCFLFLGFERDGGTGGSPSIVVEPEGSMDTGGSRPFELGTRGALLLVADGMGGAAGGARASRETARWIRKAFGAWWEREASRTPSAFAGHLVRSVEAANTHVHGLASGTPALMGMGTTLTAAGILDDFVYLAQVGDSRAYVIRDGEAAQLTRDQSMVQRMVDTGTLTEEQARHSPRRNVILQAVGTAPTVDVDLTRQQLRRGDVLLVCSDGLSGVVESAELAEYATRYLEPSELCEALVALANERGGPDNVTVVVARLDGPGLSVPADGDVIGRQPFPISS